MVTAIDSSVLYALYKGEKDGNRWIDLLKDQSKFGPLIVCDVVLAEMSGLFENEADTTHFFQDLGISHEPTHARTAILAGSIFRSYRKAGGPREHLIPDFLIGAHALRQANQIAAADRGYLRRHFPRLKVIAPR